MLFWVGSSVCFLFPVTTGRTYWKYRILSRRALGYDVSLSTAETRNGYPPANVPGACSALDLSIPVSTCLFLFLLFNFEIPV